MVPGNYHFMYENIKPPVLEPSPYFNSHILVSLPMLIWPVTKPLYFELYGIIHGQIQAT